MRRRVLTEEGFVGIVLGNFLSNTHVGTKHKLFDQSIGVLLLVDGDTAGLAKVVQLE